MVLICLSFCSCAKKDIAKNIPSVYDGELYCTVRIQVQSQPGADYIISFKREENTDSVEIISPSSVDGIKAQVQRGSAVISYEGKYLQTLLPSYWGTSPADVMSAVFDCLAEGVPQRTVIDDKIMLEYKEVTDSADLYRYIWLNKESLAFEKAEIEVDGHMLLKLECTSFQAY